jgi:hypothetical protein
LVLWAHIFSCGKSNVDTGMCSIVLKNIDSEYWCLYLIFLTQTLSYV